MTTPLAGTKPGPGLGLGSILWLLAYIAILSLVVGGVVYGRRQALAVYGSHEAQAEWDAWRVDATKIAAGPVKRRPPKSAEPPALVLMRDHFAVCLVGAVLLSTVLFGTFMFFVRGAMGDSQRASPARAGPRPSGKS